MPSARSVSSWRRWSGRPPTSPSTRAPIALSASGPSRTTVVRRFVTRLRPALEQLRAGQRERRRRRSARWRAGGRGSPATRRRRTGCRRRPARTGLVPSPTRSRNAVQAVNRSSRANVPAVAAPTSASQPRAAARPARPARARTGRVPRRAARRRWRRPRSRRAPAAPGRPPPVPRTRRPPRRTGSVHGASERRTRARRRTSRTPRPAVTCRHPPHPRRPRSRGPASLLRGVEELLHQAELAVAPHQRRLQPVDPLRAADRRHDGARRVQVHGSGPALQLVLADVLERDRRGRQRAGGVVHPHVAGRRPTPAPATRC